ALHQRVPGRNRHRLRARDRPRPRRARGHDERRGGGRGRRLLRHAAAHVPDAHHELSPDGRGLMGVRWGLLSTADINDRILAAADPGAVVAVGSRSPERAEAYARAKGIPRAHGSYDALLAD